MTIRVEGVDITFIQVAVLQYNYNMGLAFTHITAGQSMVVHNISSWHTAKEKLYTVVILVLVKFAGSKC